METSTPSEAPWESGLRGARANLVPGLLLQAASVVLVLGYYRLAVVHDALSAVSRFRESWDVPFSVLSTGLFGGVLPFLYVHFRGKGSSAWGWGQGAVLSAFWAYKGLEVDVWYRLQAHMVGSGHDIRTIVIKVIFDQFGYCPLFAVPVTAAVYQAVDAGRGWKESLSGITKPGWYRHKVLPVLIANLGVWVPAVAIIYALPTLLQLPLQNIVLCFYTLVIAHQTQRG
jgi:hypothetical protein